jgi:hypothetical protein
MDMDGLDTMTSLLTDQLCGLRTVSVPGWKAHSSAVLVFCFWRREPFSKCSLGMSLSDPDILPLQVGWLGLGDLDKILFSIEMP